jgi:hypothetical protein
MGLCKRRARVCHRLRVGFAGGFRYEVVTGDVSEDYLECAGLPALWTNHKVLTGGGFD